MGIGRTRCRGEFRNFKGRTYRPEAIPSCSSGTTTKRVNSHFKIRGVSAGVIKDSVIFRTRSSARRASRAGRSFLEGRRSATTEARVAHRSWGVQEFAKMVHGHEIIGPDEERIGWAYAVEHAGSLEVEELFVMPQFRRHGHGRSLSSMTRSGGAEGRTTQILDFACRRRA